MTNRRCNSSLQAYLDLRKHLDRAIERADAGDWEEALFEVDEAQIALHKLEQSQRNRTQPPKEAA